VVLFGFRKEVTVGLMKKIPDPQSAVLRLNAICPYYTMFPLEFPFRVLGRVSRGEWVLDPFCGRGTTNYAARLRGISSVGIDSNPVAVAIAAAKLVAASPEEIVLLGESILAGTDWPDSMPQGEFWELCYDTETLREICILRESLMRSCRTPQEIALRALILGMLHGPQNKGAPSYLSNQMPRTYATKPQPAVRYWRKRNLRPQPVRVLDVIQRKAEHFFRDLPRPVSGEIVLGDSRTVLRETGTRRFHWVITSPPYYGMRTYYSDQWLRNWFLGGPDDVVYRIDGQIPHSSREDFLLGLAAVWRNVAHVCAPGARMIVRFGSLPSAREDTRHLFRQSLVLADCGWRIVTGKPAGSATRGRRQARQFRITEYASMEEMDYYAVLEG
jgi:hypothetical protein